MIPSTAHFIWLGKELPWLERLGPVSASRHGGFDRVILHHESGLDHTAIRFLSDRIPNLETRRIPHGPAASGSLGPTARANLLRLRILLAEGGTYLDMDTITIRSFAPLFGAELFCGTEPVVFSAILLRSRNPAKWSVALAKTSLRRICRWLPDGWRIFRRLERHYELQPNNAVMGSISGHPALLDLADRAGRLAIIPGIRPKEIGVRLLQKSIAASRYSDDPGFQLLGPRRFYPLPPDISAHWFRRTKKPALHEMTSPETLCVHWYASLVPSSEARSIDEAWIRSNRNSTPIAQLISELDLVS